MLSNWGAHRDIALRRKAKEVLTSTDPDYRAKLDESENILSNLKEDEAFFSIDEYGPFAVKRKGGRKLVGPGEKYVVPQWQKSKGWTIITEASTGNRTQPVLNCLTRYGTTGPAVPFI